MIYNTKSITIKIDSVYSEAPGSQSRFSYSEKHTKELATALAVLVGKEYNKYARHVDVEKVKELQKRHDYLVQEMKNLL